MQVINNAFNKTITRDGVKKSVPFLIEYKNVSSILASIMNKAYRLFMVL